VVNKDWLDIDVLEDYLDGKLDAKTMNRVEREALEDPFVAEALAGLSASPKRSLQSISLLQKQLQDRIAEQRSIKKTSVITWQRLSIAATAAVLFVAVSIVFWMKENNRQKELAALPKKVDVTIAPKSGANLPVAATEAPAIAAAPAADQKADVAIEKAVKAAKSNQYAVLDKKKIGVTSKEAYTTQPLQEVAIVGNNVQAKRNVTASASVVMAAPMNELSGRVTAKDDGMPLVGAVVKIEGTPLQTVTDINGKFSLHADTSIKAVKISANMIGYDRSELFAKANTPVQISLAPGTAQLNEVVVTGYGLAKKEVSKSRSDTASVAGALAGRVAGTDIRIRGMATTPKMASEPIGGWNKLFDYIQTNNSFKAEPKAGFSVELSFKIDKDGKPVNIEIVKGAAAKYEDEAIRLILNGPKWELPKKANSRITFKIDF
jgi:hypothetical protein